MPTTPTTPTTPTSPTHTSSTNLPLPGQASQDLATHTQILLSRDRLLRTSLLLWPPYTNLPQIFLSRDRLLGTSLLLWPPYTNLPLPGQASQDLATPMAPIHKPSTHL